MLEPVRNTPIVLTPARVLRQLEPYIRESIRATFCDRQLNRKDEIIINLSRQRPGQMSIKERSELARSLSIDSQDIPSLDRGKMTLHPGGTELDTLEHNFNRASVQIEHVLLPRLLDLFQSAIALSSVELTLRFCNGYLRSFTHRSDSPA